MYSSESSNSVSDSTAKELRELLEAFCNYWPEVSYVQGMTYLADMFLKYMQPPTAFVCLVRLINSDFFSSYVSMDVTEIRLRFRIFQVIFHHNNPTLKRKFNMMRLVPDCYLMEWCMTMFTKQLPFPHASRVWDGYLNHGEIFIFKAAMGLLNVLEPKLRNANLSDCIRILREPQITCSEDRLMKVINAVKVPKRIEQYFAEDMSSTTLPQPSSSTLKK